MSLRKRLARVERTLADTAKRKEEAGCNCRLLTAASSRNPAEFEAEMNLPCPVHGIRHLGQLMVVTFVQAVNGKPDTSAPKDPLEVELKRLLDEYHARQRSRRNASQVGLEYDSKEP
jgi:hypothetical protein